MNKPSFNGSKNVSGSLSGSRILSSSLILSQSQVYPNTNSVLGAGNPIHCKSYLISLSKDQILQCDWHPLSASGADLVVLQENGQVHIFDLYKSVTEPDQTYYCLDANATKSFLNPYFPEKEMFQVASFCFGLSVEEFASFKDPKYWRDLAWLPLTLFVTMRNGDLVTLCPVVPRHW